MFRKVLKLLYLCLLLPSLIGIGGGLLTSCKEKEEVGEYDNWKKRNDAYIDSIAQVCRVNADGQWVALRSFDLGTSQMEDNDPQHYVYVHKLGHDVKYTSDYHPQYNDSVRVHYSGHLIPSDSYEEGYNFNRSYYGYTLDEETDVPTLVGVDSRVSGLKTALMEMVEGDEWRIYIPYFLAYNASEQSTVGIPAYSNLIFDVKLIRVYRYMIDTDTRWW